MEYQLPLHRPEDLVNPQDDDTSVTRRELNDFYLVPQGYLQGKTLPIGSTMPLSDIFSRSHRLQQVPILRQINVSYLSQAWKPETSKELTNIIEPDR